MEWSPTGARAGSRSRCARLALERSKAADRPWGRRPPPGLSGAQQCLDGPALVHRAVALGHLVQRQGHVENLAGVDLSREHQVYQLWQVAAYRRGTAMQVDMREEQFLAVERHTVR